MMVLPPLLLATFCVQGSLAQERNPISKRAAIPTQKVPQNVESPMKTAGVLYQSGNRRDPFLNPLLIAKKEKPADEEVSRGEPPPGIAGTYIDQAVLQGIASRDHGRVAIVRGADTRAYFLKEGDRLFDGYLKTIDSDSITLIRETKMRSGKVLTQDVTKRLRKP
jgi:Tfp pilus assembly protein PilP